MDMDNDWVEDVKRWCRAGGTTASRTSTAARTATSTATSAATFSSEDDHAAFGYEAANPSIQARNWPDAATTFATVSLKH